MSLRRVCIEAGARELFDRDDINPERKPWHEETVEAVLDAILHAIEAQAFRLAASSRSWERQAVAALGVEGDESQ